MGITIRNNGQGGRITFGNLGLGGSISTNVLIPPDPNYACVSGAGSTEVNGTYVFTDNYTYPLLGTRPRYQNIVSGITIIAAQGFAGDFYRWFFYYYDPNEDTNNYWYRGNTNPAPAYPWLETSWDIYYGVAPVPTVIIGQC